MLLRKLKKMGYQKAEDEHNCKNTVMNYVGTSPDDE